MCVLTILSILKKKKKKKSIIGSNETPNGA